MLFLTRDEIIIQKWVELLTVAIFNLMEH